MPGRFKTLEILSIAATFILLEVAAIAMLRHSSPLEDLWLNRVSQRVSAFCWGWTGDVSRYLSLAGENERLVAENHALEAQLREAQAIIAARDLEEYGAAHRLSPDFLYIPARIAKISRGGQHNYVIIDKGSEDGITPGAGIVTPNGVVGIIGAVDRHYSYGRTLMNPGVGISVKTGSDGMSAILRWDGKSTEGALLQDLPIHYEVTPQDTVFTSGYSAIFPSGIPLGVTGELRTVDGLSAEVQVSLFQDFRRLDFVTVVVNPDKEEMEALQR